MWRAAASLERVPAVSKEGLGDVALRNAIAGRGDYGFWAVGRFGARVPLYGPVAEVISKEKVEGWIERLLAANWSKHHGITLTVAQLARLCGDAQRDIDEGLRNKVVDQLRAADCPSHLIDLVTQVTVLRDSEKAQLFGDSVPEGLRLSSASDGDEPA